MPSRALFLLSTLALGLAGCADDTGDGAGGSARSGGTTSAESSTSASSGELGACSWEGADPGDLVATGSAVGDVIADVSGIVDQCGVARSLWDFAGGYRIVVLAEGW